MEKILEKGRTNPNVIWEIKKATWTDPDLEYDIRKEDGTVITDPEEARKHCADYFEDLYQARPGTTEYKEWTTHITEKVQTIVKNHKLKGIQEEKITMEELEKTIKKLRRNKSVGPDQIPNEMFLEATKETKEIYLEIINQIDRTEEIPAGWQQGEIKRIYKGKGSKGKCSNERGISLASNFGKLYERILNNRIKNDTKISEAQAGGTPGNATVDHLMTLKSIIKHIRKRRKPAHIVFLDVQKAYDKAWLDAILYVLDKNGLRGKNWELVRKLNSNLKAKVQTKHGLTREITIRDSIRQGGVLSVIEYATLIDEIAKELKNQNMGIEIEGVGKIPCLLWMDDVALIHENENELQKMLDCTNDIAKRYHIEFGAAKCQVITIGKALKKPIKLGNTGLENTNTYKYLGEVINSKNNLEDHLRTIEGKLQAAKEKIFTITGNQNFKGIKMRAIWEMITTCIIPIITYGAEGWKTLKKEEEKLQGLFTDTLKTFLKLPTSTPNLIIMNETGFLPIMYTVHRKKIMQANRIVNMTGHKLIKKITCDTESDEWIQEALELMDKYGVEKRMIYGKKDALKREVKRKQNEKFMELLQEEAQQKSKTKHYMENTEAIQPGKRPPYMNHCTRKQCETIIRTRSRMLEVKANYKGNHLDTKCRYCDEEEEDQEHILSKCKKVKEITGKDIKYDKMFKNNCTKELTTETILIMEMLDTLKTWENQGKQ